jgi:WD40 repeat protein
MRGWVRVTEAATGKEVFAKRLHDAAILSVAASAKDNWVATASADKSVKVWALGPAGALAAATTLKLSDQVLGPAGRCGGGGLPGKPSSHAACSNC